MLEGFALRRRRRTKKIATAAIKARATTPMAIPALAPVEIPLEGDGGGPRSPDVFCASLVGNVVEAVVEAEPVCVVVTTLWVADDSAAASDLEASAARDRDADCAAAADAEEAAISDAFRM